MIALVLKAESLAQRGLQLMRAAGEPSDLTEAGMDLGRAALETRAVAPQESSQNRRMCLMASAKVMAEAADLLLCSAFMEGPGELPSDVQALYTDLLNAGLLPVVSNGDMDPTPTALSPEEGEGIRFNCPALGRVLTVNTCARNALRETEEPCSLACETGRYNVERLGCGRAVELLEVG